jgi:dienelactone hydrolase
MNHVVDAQLETSKNPKKRGRRLKIVLFVLVSLVVLFVRPASHHARAASLLVSFSDPKAVPTLAEERITIDVPKANELASRTVPARVFAPVGAKGLPGVVLVHGVHRKGMMEPRLERFARAVANAGVVVLVPEISELSDYHVSPRSIETVGASIKTLRSRIGRSQVGLMGFSFGGGVALLSAADSRFADDVAFVVAVGAHDDLGRVSRFFATNEIEEASGGTKSLHAHDYGAMVLVYAHIEDFFPADDVPAAKDAIRHWLWDERAEARESAKALSPSSQERIEKLFKADVASIKTELLAEVDRRANDMEKVSPHGHLTGLHANVYLLHGEGDAVIPATETLWLAKDVPAGHVRSVLVTPAIEHVELKEPTTTNKLELVHFMGQVISEAEATR